MSTLASPGIGSGLDVNGIVEQLMLAERRPLVALQKRESEHQAKLTAYGQIRSVLDNFQNTLKGLTAANVMAAIILKRLRLPLTGSLIVAAGADEETGGRYGFRTQPS